MWLLNHPALDYHSLLPVTSDPRKIPPLFSFSVSQVSVFSLVWREAQSRLGSILARLEVSPLDVAVGFQWFSANLNPPQWREPTKQQQRQVESKIGSPRYRPTDYNVLPGFQRPLNGHTRMVVGVSLGLNSGVEFKVNDICS